MITSSKYLIHAEADNIFLVSGLYLHWLWINCMYVFLLLNNPLSLFSLSLGRTYCESHGCKDYWKCLHYLFCSGPGLYYRGSWTRLMVPIQTFHCWFSQDHSNIGKMEHLWGIYLGIFKYEVWQTARNRVNFKCSKISVNK